MKLLLLSLVCFGVCLAIGAELPLFNCEETSLATEWLLAKRLYGDCVSKELFMDFHKRIFNEKLPSLLLLSDIAFDKADINKDGHMSLEEFLVVSKIITTDFLELKEADIKELYENVFARKGISDRQTFKLGFVTCITSLLPGEAWDVMNIREDTCLDEAEYKKGICQMNSHMIREQVFLMDDNDDKQVSKNEFMDWMEEINIHSKPVAEMIWLMVNPSEKPFITEEEALDYAEIKIQHFIM